MRTAHDVRHWRMCSHCNRPGDGRKMLTISRPGLFHDYCVVELLPESEILALPESERVKFSIGAVSPDLMRKLVEAYCAPTVLGSDTASTTEPQRLAQPSKAP